MSEEIKREALLKVANLVRPALAKGNYMPALQHISFNGKYATAFNDISAISVRVDMEVKRLLPGEMLIKSLQSFSAENVALAQKDKEVVLSSGRSKLKLPTLGTEDFPLKWPEEEGDEIELSAPIVRGIERCLMNVGNDPTHPECMGVTLDTVDGDAVLFSTDNFTVSRYETDVELKLPGDTPVILPTFFCDQLVTLAKSFGDEELSLTIYPGALVAEFGTKARLLTRTLVDKEPLDFPAMLKKQLQGVKNLKKELLPIPDAFDAALSRALLVLEAELDKVTTFALTDNGFTLHSSSSMGDSDDVMKCEDSASFNSPEEFYLDPALVARGAKVSALLGFLKGSVVLADKDARFVHLIAYCSK